MQRQDPRGKTKEAAKTRIWRPDTRLAGAEAVGLREPSGSTTAPHARAQLNRAPHAPVLTPAASKRQTATAAGHGALTGRAVRRGPAGPTDLTGGPEKRGLGCRPLQRKDRVSEQGQDGPHKPREGLRQHLAHGLPGSEVQRQQMVQWPSNLQIRRLETRSALRTDVTETCTHIHQQTDPDCSLGGFLATPLAMRGLSPGQGWSPAPAAAVWGLNHGSARLPGQHCF